MKHDDACIILCSEVTAIPVCITLVMHASVTNTLDRNVHRWTHYCSGIRTAPVSYTTAVVSYT